MALATRWVFVGSSRRWRSKAASDSSLTSSLAGYGLQRHQVRGSGAANAQRAFAKASRAGARDVSASASAILSDNDGAMIEAMHVVYSGDSKAVETQSDLFGSMAEAVDECSRIVRDARSQMDAIDREAHEAIQKVIDSKGGWFGPLAMLAMIWAILTQARAAADAVSAAAVANIGSQAMRVQAATEPHARCRWGAVGASQALPSGRSGHFFQAGNDMPTDRSLGHAAGKRPHEGPTKPPQAECRRSHRRRRQPKPDTGRLGKRCFQTRDQGSERPDALQDGHPAAR